MDGSRSSRILVAGDVGGTKTTLALYDSGDVRAPRTVRTYSSRAAASLDSLLDDFVSHGPAPHSASLAVAGPVVDGAARLTNLPWVVSERELEKRCSFSRARLVNDVEALGWTATALHPTELATLREGRRESRGPLAVLALGTGFGQGYVTGAPDSLQPHASEGGHADFAPTTPLQARLLESLRREFGHVSVERVCSGTGLPRIHRFLVDEEGWREEPSTAREIAQASDPTPVIVRAATQDSSATCREAVALLCDLFAAEIGNLALKILSTGGIFLGGGLPPRVLSFLQADRFQRAFLSKGRMTPLLEAMPLHVILPGDAVLWGAALCGMQEECGSGTPHPPPEDGSPRGGQRRGP